MYFVSELEKDEYLYIYTVFVLLCDLWPADGGNNRCLSICETHKSSDSLWAQETLLLTAPTHPDMLNVFQI